MFLLFFIYIYFCTFSRTCPVANVFLFEACVCLILSLLAVTVADNLCK